MASWLYECLCEAELAQYYPHFTALGLQKIDELAKVTMKDYSKLGVHDMNDRKRLFHLIKIIKIMQEEDKVACSPEHPLSTSSLYTKPQEFRSGPRRQLHFDSPADSKDRTASNETCSLPDSSVDEKSTCLKVLEHLLSDDSQDCSETRALNTSAAGACIQTETSTSLFSSNYFSSKLGNCDIPIIQRVSHVAGYNYGIPHSCVRQSTSENPWTEMEKIRVCVRKRPLGVREVRRGEINIITVEDKETLLVHEKKEAVDLTQYILQHVFYFDEVFGEACTNRDVYLKTTHPLIQHVFSGGNATCFAYGQTGAGKTYTMIGSHQNPGLYALAAKDIFRQLEESQPRNLFVWISFYEIYCGQLYDLLNRRKRLFAREDSKHVVQIVGLRELQVDSVQLLLEVILKGSKERSTGATGVNSDSSRSHAIIQIQIKDSAKRTFGRISFIDLAGSERAADARDSDKQTKMEGAEINQSLLALKECIRALDQEHTHTPFRQSKLTQVLKDSFIGNAKTCMIANISPSHVATEHTLNTLRYADRVKELKKGIKCCVPTASRSRTSGNSSPKRIQSSPVALPGDKCSPKKVKLGLQQSLTVAPGSTRGKAYPLTSHAPNIPFASVPKVHGKRGGPKGSPSQEWGMKATPVEANMQSGHVAKKGAEEPVSPCSEKSQVSNKTTLGRVGRTSGPGGNVVHGKLPTKCKKVQTVQPVQKQPVSRVELPCGNSQPVAEDSQPGKVGTPARLASDTWMSIPPHQKEREEHLRFYHQQFQQPPLLKQKLKYQPLERFLCQHRSSEGQLQNGTVSPFNSNSESQDGVQTEDPDDSDFSEDSFSHVSCQRAAARRSPSEKSAGSFFLHQNQEPSPEQQCLFFSARTDGEEQGPAGSWVYSKDPLTAHRRATLRQSHGSGEALVDWSKEDSVCPAPSRDQLADEAGSPHTGLVCHQGGEARAFDIRQETFRSELLGQAEDGSPSSEHESSFSPSHVVVPASLDQRDTVRTPLQEVGEGSAARGPRTVKSDPPLPEGSRGQLGTYRGNASGLMAPLTVSLLETSNDEASALQQLDPGAMHGPLDEITGGPVVGCSVSSFDGEAALLVSPAPGRLWLSSSPPDNRPGGSLPALSPSPIHQHPPDRLPNREAHQSGRPALFAQRRVDGERCDAGEGTEPSGCWSFPEKPGTTALPRTPSAGPSLASYSERSDVAGHPWTRGSAHPTEHYWQPLDSVKLPCYDKDMTWLKHRPASRFSASLDRPLTPSCSSKASGARCHSTLKQAQQMVIRAHQEQLDEMAELGFKEETLLSQLASNDFEDFVTQLDEIMALKSKCIQSLRSQLQLFLTCHRPAAAPERTVVS